MIALVYVAVIGWTAFWFASSTFTEYEGVDRRKLVLFLLANAMGFVVAPITSYPELAFYATIGISILILKPQDPVHQIAMFLFLLPLIPALDYQPALGSTPLVELTWPRLLSILLLVPLVPRALKSKPLFHHRVDKYIWIFFALSILLGFRDTTITNGLRVGVGIALDLLIPYLVLSRILQNADDVRTVVLPFVAALVFAGALNTFESIRSWNVYVQVMTDVTGRGVAIADRAGLRRAFGALDRPSQSAMALATGIGLLWMLSPYAKSRTRLLFVLVTLIAGLIVTFSRGSWVAAVLIGAGYLATTNFVTFLKVSLGGILVAIPLMYFPMTQEVLRILPSLGEEGTQAADTVSYRQELFDAAIFVAAQNPFFGSTVYDQHPELDRLRLASGLLDLVNHYVILMLSMGYIGLLSFLAIFASTLGCLFRANREVRTCPMETKTLIHALTFTLMGLLLAIATTSAGAKGGIILWCLVAVSAVSTQTNKKRVMGRH